jgi:hypothetical protein
MKSICVATNVLNPKDSKEFHNKKIEAFIAIEDRKDKPGEQRNVVKNYRAVENTISIVAKESAPPWKK